MLTLKEKLEKIENSNSLLDLNSDVLPKVHKENYYFVSYSHKDYKKVMKDILLLEEEGINIWYDSDMHIGENWEDIAEMYISKFQCKGIIFYLSENSILSKACNKEVDYVLENNKQFFSINIPLNNNINNNMCGLDMLLKLKEEGNAIDDALIENFEKAFPSNTLYLNYNDSIKRKKEQILKLVGEDLFEFELTFYENDSGLLEENENPYTLKLTKCRDNSLVSLNLKTNYLYKNNNDSENNEKMLPLSAIDECIFTNLFQLKEVALPKTVVEIGPRAFSNCYKLSKINLDNKMFKIGRMAFSGCVNLDINKITCSIIDPYAFNNCNSLHHIDLYSRMISEGAFISCSNIKEIKLGNECAIIDKAAFHSCSSLEKIYFNNNENIIDPNIELKLLDSCFSRCTALNDITLSGKTNINKANYAFGGCKNLKTVKLNTSKKLLIPEGMFFGCESLYKVEGIEKYKIISSNAFSECINLKYLDLNYVREIKKNAFTNTGLELISLKNVNIIERHAFSNNKKLEEITIGNMIELIDEGILSGCENLKKIEILGKKIKINMFAFENVYPEIFITSNYDSLKVFLNELINDTSKLKVIYTESNLIDLIELNNLSSNKFHQIVSDKLGFDKFVIL